MSSSPLTDAELDSRFEPIYARIAAGAVAREQQRTLAHEPVAWLREAGLGALRVPRSHGGLGASLPQLLRQLVRLGQADSNLPQIFRAHFGFVEGRLSSNDAASQDYWFARVVAGELWGAAMAERTDSTGNTVQLSEGQDGYQLDGEKYYCTGTLYADWVAAVANHGDDFVSLVIPTHIPGVEVIDDWDGFGQRLTGSGTTRFHQVAVPERHVLRRFAKGELRAESYLTAFYQAVHLATLVGIGRAVLADAVAFVQGRTRAFGIPGQSRPAEDPLVQGVIGRLASLAFAAEAQLTAVGQSLQRVVEAGLQGEVPEQLYTDAEVHAFQAQQVVLPQVLQACSLLFEVGGASATSNARRLDRHWRNARTLASHNPAIYREQALGNYYLNGISPAQAWRARHAAATEGQGAGDEASAV
ncbi:acyl-CoA dehydrogenase family protein [Pseudomonas guariconensis]|uniref:acyl-CoA dehydrogenase family protein n=1 Tax=Pseudomonas TaxID=286 RepID=UPI0020977539|nr:MULTISPECIES: acyl-CoA dehydrogenase family protein [Pseudomonas]MCO7640234.1 acyl-CoA dehydrogenase family protein [Pseudomonas sp. S 311-6]MCO7515964.1 acyl-CoA dehydrogenase family protein [Pseudomonas putida]MCO7565574.1 acyl-CoA dehydrogenase family protein [Pseudomonas mosselii]MCO7606437.1 acyl-CoA dehydrogenase family protein [Pseudomonas guariconensis]MCO7617682.1 acyl-CoA dehydrogenase family protein [Pseudomonas guariconensis]